MMPTTRPPHSDRHAFDAAALHHVHDVFQRRGDVDGLHVGGHHFGHLAAVRMAVFGGDAAGTHQELEPARAPPLGLGLATTQEVAFRQHADQVAVFVDHRQAADVMLEHQPRRLQHGCIRIDRDHLAGHHIFGVHGSLHFGCYASTKTRS